MTNWKRKLGCKCQYKHIVDWCGCSPNVFLASDWNRILGTQEHDLYFARKFEPVVDLVVINRLESMILEQPLARGEHDVSYNRYWQSIYDRDDRSPAPDGSLTVYQGLASKAVHHVREKCQNRSISSLSHLIWDEVAVAQVNLLMERNRLRGLLINFLSLPNQLDHQVTGEALVRPRRHFIIRKRTYPINRLVGMQVCSEMDQKEMIFRNWGCILSPLSEPSLMHKWRISAEKNSNFTVTFAWVDPSGVTAAASEVRIDTPADPEREDLMLYHKPAINQPLPAGVWRLLLLYADVIAAESKFLIAPILLPDGRQHAPRMRRSGRKAANPSQSDTKLNLSHIQKAILDSNYLEEARRRSKGSHLQSAEPIGSDAPKIEWMDSLLSHFWSLEDVCYNALMGDLSASEKHGIPRQANDTQVMRKDVCRNGRMKSCLKTDWSSFSPDPKSEISFS